MARYRVQPKPKNQRIIPTKIRMKTKSFNDSEMQVRNLKKREILKNTPIKVAR